MLQKPNRIISKKGTRQVGTLTSAERGQLVTVTCAVIAISNFFLPMFVFPRLRYQERFVRDSPTGSIGASNASEWMLEEDFFLNTLKIFFSIYFTQSSSITGQLHLTHFYTCP